LRQGPRGRNPGTATGASDEVLALAIAAAREFIVVRSYAVDRKLAHGAKNVFEKFEVRPQPPVDKHQQEDYEDKDK